MILNKAIIVPILLVLFLFCSINFLDLNQTTTTTELQQQNVSQKLDRAEFIKEMAKQAWQGYVKYAWAQDALDPVNQLPLTLDFGNNSGWTILASMSTLHTMELNEEFEQGKLWIQKQLNLTQVDANLKVDLVEVDYVGALLSCYALTQDKMFLNKAVEISKLLQPANNYVTGKTFWTLCPVFV